MPVVTVYGLPRWLGEIQFAEIASDWREGIIDALLTVEELASCLREEMVVRFLVSGDLRVQGSIEYIHIEISMLVGKIRFDYKVRNRLAEAAGRAVKARYRTKITCVVLPPIDQNDGFWEGSKPPSA